MGSGKSTIGKKIAARLNKSFIDMDAEIEKESGKSVAEIFKSYGEIHFRQMETEWLKKFSEQMIVVSCGGGTPCFNNNIDIMKSKGKVVFIDVKPEILASRLLQSKSTRPLIENYIHSKENLTSYIQQKLNERITFYHQADLIIDGSSLNADSLNNICEQIASLH